MKPTIGVPHFHFALFEVLELIDDSVEDVLEAAQFDFSVAQFFVFGDLRVVQRFSTRVHVQGYCSSVCWTRLESLERGG